MKQNLGLAFASELRRKKVARDEFWQAVIVGAVLLLMILAAGFVDGQVIK